MATEYKQDSFYEASKKKFIDIHTSTKCCIEWFISKLLFKGDLNRVCYAMPDATFRRRIELLDAGVTEDSFNPISLQLPYASYYQSADWDADDRESSSQAGQAIVGEYIQDIYQRVRSIAVKSNYKINCFFSRRDDIRLAEQLVLQEKLPQSPIWLYSVVNWRGHKLGIPINITIDTVTTQPQWNELTLLEQQRIFPMEISLTVRSYFIQINNIDQIIPLPIRFQDYADNWEDGDVIYLTEKTILDFACEKFNLSTEVDDSVLDDPTISKYASKYFDVFDPTKDEVSEFVKECPSCRTEDILSGYFSEDASLTLSTYQYIKDKSTPTSAYIAYNFNDTSKFQCIKFVVPGHKNLEITDAESNYVIIDGLYPNSTYDIIIMAISSTNTIKTYKLSFTTMNTTDNEAPTPRKINKKITGLVGMEI